jgi:hypothetical protein
MPTIGYGPSAVPGVLTVDGVDYDQAGRKAARLIVNAWGWDWDRDYWLEFYEYASGYKPTFRGCKSVQYRDAGGTLRFSGVITAVQPGLGAEGRTWGYRCQGLKYSAAWLPVVAIDGGSRMSFNAPVGDDAYDLATVGKTVGEIVSAVLTQHATALTALGIAADSTTTAQLATLTLVPPERVDVRGERLTQGIDDVLRKYARNVRWAILPDGKIRFQDVAQGTSRTLTVGRDCNPPLLTRSWADCATRTQLRGAGRIYPFYGSQSAAQLVPAWTTAQRNAWKWSDYAAPGDGTDAGNVVTTSGPTSVTISSSSPAAHWVANFWNGRDAWIQLYKTSGSGATYQESAKVTACTALVAGGTSTLTLDPPLENSAATAWDKYVIVARSAPLTGADTGLNNVWRLYDVVTPGGLVEDHLVTRLPEGVEFPWFGYNNAAAQSVSTPICQVLYNGSGGPQPFSVIPETGQILFDRPTCADLGVNTPAQLATGGAAIVGPTDILVMLPYSRGALAATYPPDVSGSPAYAGTAYTLAGLERTQTVDVDSWGYEGNAPQLLDLAEMLNEASRDEQVSGNVRVMGPWLDVLDPTGGHLICFDDVGGEETGDEALNAPLRACTVRLDATGKTGLVYSTELKIDTRRDPKTETGFYTHLSALAGRFSDDGPQGNWRQANAANLETLRAQAGAGPAPSEAR